jgi:PQQ-dependent catabolism-associated CXXCW motif protein
MTHKSTAVAFIAMLCLSVATTRPSHSQSHGDIPEPDGFRLEDYRKPVPATLTGARGVLNADAAKDLRDKGAVFIDVYPRAPKPPNLPASTVWREPPHRSIEGAIWLPNVGYGVLAEPVRAYFDDNLAKITGGDRAKPVIFFCLRDCWMSWNAAKRSIAMGYTATYWFPEGTDAWEESGYPLTTVTPLP